MQLPRYYAMVPDLDATVSSPLRSNAVKFMPAGAQIDVRALWEDNSALISVRDTDITFTFSIPIRP
jgi:signal transduction histidine kinase